MREYSIALIRRSYWYYAGQIAVAFALALGGVYVILAAGPSLQQSGPVGMALIALGLIMGGVIPLEQRTVLWRITSDRLIEQRGLLATSRRELELQDIRSIEVNRRLGQRLTGLGDVIVASAASADFVIRLADIYDPEGVAETIRKARLKRLA